MKEFKEFIFKYKYVFMFVLGILILFCRSGYNLKNPIMYAEDGTWYSRLIREGWMSTIVNSRYDYYVFILASLLKIVDLMAQ